MGGEEETTGDREGTRKRIDISLLWKFFRGGGDFNTENVLLLCGSGQLKSSNRVIPSAAALLCCFVECFPFPGIEKKIRKGARYRGAHIDE